LKIYKIKYRKELVTRRGERKVRERKRRKQQMLFY